MSGRAREGHVTDPRVPAGRAAVQSLQLLHSPALLLPGEILGLRKIPGAELS